MNDVKSSFFTPQYIFEVSHEVCHKVGGIYTVLASRAATMQRLYGDHAVFIGPDLGDAEGQTGFVPDGRLLRSWQKAAAAEGLAVRIGRWEVPGRPIAILVDATSLRAERNDLYARAWEHFGVDSLHAYGDYDEAALFSVAAARFVAAVYRHCLARKAPNVIYQAHEWMAGMGMLWLRREVPEIATIFTTHATSIGRSITGNGKLLYKYFSGYHGHQMAAELNMEAKHSLERQCAHYADCFTTVSSITAKECKQLLEREPDVVLPNGFESDFVPVSKAFTSKRHKARQRWLHIAQALTGETLPSDTLIVSTSGRNDYRCKGFDVFLEALARLKALLQGSDKQVLAIITVPCWVREPRPDLLSNMNTEQPQALPHPFITHDLHNFHEDAFVRDIQQLRLDAPVGSPVKVLLVPCYLDGNDGIVQLSYYDALTASDLTVYPSYYEPWGYTPLESIAFRTPTLTTDLAGFGQWAAATLRHPTTLQDGVCVLHRDDDNTADLAQTIAETIRDLAGTSPRQRTAMRSAAFKLSQCAHWQHFIAHYQEAYAKALRTAQQRDAARERRDEQRALPSS